MRLSLKTFITLFLSSILISCSSPSSSENEELQAGKFEASTTGTIEKQLSGDANYSISEIETYQQDFLFISLKVGTLPFEPNSSTGVLLAIPWDSTTTSLSIDNSPISNIYTDPDSYRQIYLDTGSVNIEEKSKNTLAGTFNLNASVDETEIKISGKFKANKSE
jgi:hypothetical protein